MLSSSYCTFLYFLHVPLVFDRSFSDYLDCCETVVYSVKVAEKRPCCEMRVLELKAGVSYSCSTDTKYFLFEMLFHGGSF